MKGRGVPGCAQECLVRSKNLHAQRLYPSAGRALWSVNKGQRHQISTMDALSLDRGPGHAAFPLRIVLRLWCFPLPVIVGMKEKGVLLSGLFLYVICDGSAHST